MKKAILLTGTPGTGKTTIALYLKKKGYVIVNTTELVQEEQLYEEYDNDRDCYVVAEKQLSQVLHALILNNEKSLPIVIDGHVAIIDKKYLKKCIVLRCSIQQLRQRLQQRNYSDEKVAENVQAEIMEVILTDMLHLYGEDLVEVVYTDVNKSQLFEKIEKIVEK